MADERKAIQEDLDSLRKWWGHNKLERLGHNFWATLYIKVKIPKQYYKIDNSVF